MRRFRFPTKWLSAPARYRRRLAGEVALVAVVALVQVGGTAVVATHGPPGGGWADGASTQGQAGGGLGVTGAVLLALGAAVLPLRRSRTTCH